MAKAKSARTHKRHTRLDEKRRRKHIHRRESKGNRSLAPAKAVGVRPALDIIVKRNILTLVDIDPATVADCIDEFMVFLKQRTGWHVHISRQTLQVQLADIIAVVGPTIEFALQVKGKDVEDDVLERFVLSLINALIARINAYAKTNFIIDNSVLETLAISFRSVYNALQQDWNKLGAEEQTNAVLKLLSRCFSGCVATCRRQQA